MSKWFRFGLDKTTAIAERFGEEHDFKIELEDWCKANCRDLWNVEFRRRLIKRKTSVLIGGWTEVRYFFYVSIKSGRDATLFKMYFSDDIVSHYRFRP